MDMSMSKEVKAVIVVNQIIIVILSLALALTWHGVAVIFPILTGIVAICLGVKQFRELYGMVLRDE